MANQSDFLEVAVLDKDGFHGLLSWSLLPRAAPQGKVHNEHICFKYRTIVFRAVWWGGGIIVFKSVFNLSRHEDYAAKSPFRAVSSPPLLPCYNNDHYHHCVKRGLSYRYINPGTRRLLWSNFTLVSGPLRCTTNHLSCHRWPRHSYITGRKKRRSNFIQQTVTIKRF